MIPNDIPDSKNPLTVAEIAITYQQEKDGCDGGDDFQTLDITTENAGGGTYFVIKTDRWAFDTIEEFVKILDDFKSRFK